MQMLRGHWQLLLITALIFALWQSPVIVPLKILIVFLHELSHAAVIILTGGTVESLSISPQQGGLVLARGGSRFWSLSAGYLGSLLIGVGLLYSALRTKADSIIVAGFGLVMLLIALLYVRHFFALAFVIGTGCSLLAVARFTGHAANDLVLRVLGVTSILYVPYDIFSDTITRSGQRSDARMLAEEFGGATVIWGGLWLIISLLVIVACVRSILGRESNIVWRR